MFTWLYRCFIKDYQDIQQPRVRAAYGKLSGVVGIAANVALAAAKFLTAAWSGSLAVAADAINNLSDASSSVVSLVGFRMANKPADAEHPYGHARSEYLSGLIVSVLIIVVGWTLRGSIEKVLFPRRCSSAGQLLPCWQCPFWSSGGWQRSTAPPGG